MEQITMPKGINDGLFATGRVRITVRGPDGKIKESTVSNTVVNVGKAHIANLLVEGSETTMTNMAIGTGTTPVDPTDTALEVPISSLPFDERTQGDPPSDSNKVYYKVTWASNVPLGTFDITEAGIFNAAGIMLARTVFQAKNKGPGDSLTITWTITIAPPA